MVSSVPVERLLEDIPGLVLKLIHEPKTMQKLSARSVEICDGLGVQRVAQEIERLFRESI